MESVPLIFGGLLHSPYGRRIRLVVGFLKFFRLRYLRFLLLNPNAVFRIKHYFALAARVGTGFRTCNKTGSEVWRPA